MVILEWAMSRTTKMHFKLVPISCEWPDMVLNFFPFQWLDTLFFENDADNQHEFSSCEIPSFRTIDIKSTTEWSNQLEGYEILWNTLMTHIKNERFIKKKNFHLMFFCILFRWESFKMWLFLETIKYFYRKCGPFSVDIIVNSTHQLCFG